MAAIRISVLVVLSMLAFAANSLLCRAALLHSDIDAASFTTIRLLSGAITLWLLLALSGRASIRYGNWWGALALFVYAAAFSFAYNGLSTATGALLLFGAVQTTMVAYGIWHGERFTLDTVVGHWTRNRPARTQESVRNRRLREPSHHGHSGHPDCCHDGGDGGRALDFVERV